MVAAARMELCNESATLVVAKPVAGAAQQLVCWISVWSHDRTHTQQVGDLKHCLLGNGAAEFNSKLALRLNLACIHPLSALLAQPSFHFWYSVRIS